MAEPEHHTITNKVARSGLITIDLEDWYPSDDEMESMDLASFLFKGLILREKEFREAVDAFDWSRFKEKKVAVYCSADAIIPSWAYMLVTSALFKHTPHIYFGTLESVSEQVLLQRLNEHSWEQYSGKRVLLKGCSGKTIPPSAYMCASRQLLNYADRLMYGEACSFVPVYRS
ncbi:DUF2480 family protein [Balneolaceae bacterium ANBcel3]|nr:DUF2480 family protein [Balneolaceae bacterium ANBcel3]